MQRKKVVCDSLLFSYQKWKWVHKALEGLRADLVITALTTRDLADPGSLLRKINPCFCVWTLFTLSCCYKLSGKCCTPKNIPKAGCFQELFSKLWWQLTTETVIICQNKILGDIAGLPVLTTHKSFPDQLPVWAGGSCSSLPSSYPHCCRHSLSQGNLLEISEIPHADTRGCATWCILLLQRNFCICSISMQSSSSVGYRHIQILSRGYSSTPPSFPAILLPSSAPHNSSTWCTLPYLHSSPHHTLGFTGLILPNTGGF